jgi:hypothetical protein
MPSKKYSPVNFRGSGSLSAGDLLYYQDGDWVRLPIGSTGAILKSQGNGLPPAWDGGGGASSLSASVSISSDPNTIFLLKGEGLDGSSDFYDSSIFSHSISSIGSPIISTAESVFGDSSIKFDGGDGLVIPDHEGFDFGSKDITIDLWYRFTSLIGNHCFISHAQDTNYNWFYRYNGSNKRLEFKATNGGSILKFALASWTPVVNVWYHLAITISGSNMSFYVDGTKLSESSVSYGNFQNISGDLTVGSFRSNTDFCNGYIDELRLSKDIKRWDSEFTPPSAPYA